MTPAGCCRTCVLGPSVDVWHKADAQDVYGVKEFQSLLTKPALGPFSSLNPKRVKHHRYPRSTAQSSNASHKKYGGDEWTEHREFLRE